MSWEALNKRQFFHGTTEEMYPGDTIEPAVEHQQGVVFPTETDPRYAYATMDEGNAWHYAELAWDARGSGVPHVYEVRPMGRHSKDPQVGKNGYRRGNFEDDRRSKDGWDIVREVPMPEDMGEPEDWK